MGRTVDGMTHLVEKCLDLAPLQQALALCPSLRRESTHEHNQRLLMAPLLSSPLDTLDRQPLHVLRRALDPLYRRDAQGEVVRRVVVVDAP